MSDPAQPKPDLPPEAFNTPKLKRQLARAILAKHFQRLPRFWEALEGDAKTFLQVRGEAHELTSRTKLVRAAIRLSWETDAFFALALYRARGRLLARGIPLLPTVIHKACMAICQLDIGEPVFIEPGVYVPHGQLVIDGDVEIGRGTVLTPWVSIGLIEGNLDAPKIGRWTLIGTGAKILGNVQIGARAKIGANSVVLSDVPSGASVAGVPARPVGRQAKAAAKMRAAIAGKLAKTGSATTPDLPAGRDPGSRKKP